MYTRTSTIYRHPNTARKAWGGIIQFTDHVSFRTEAATSPHADENVVHAQAWSPTLHDVATQQNTEDTSMSGQEGSSTGLLQQRKWCSCTTTCWLGGHTAKGAFSPSCAWSSPPSVQTGTSAPPSLSPSGLS
uniref:Uncharacterized protein n=1 Tax=Arundo donax TaxID=35708 RepID=A0A0A9EQK1_ARUDO